MVVAPAITKNIDVPFVKYANEKIDTIRVIIPLAFYNANDFQLWAKVSIQTRGRYNWMYDNGSTFTTVQIPANGSAVAKLVVKPEQSIESTTFDTILLYITYYKDDKLTQQYGNDSVNVGLHLFFQNGDLSWTSEEYPDEKTIVYEKWTNVFNNLEIITIGTNNTTHDIPGDNGAAVLRIHYWESTSGSYCRISADNYLVEPNGSLKLLLFSADHYGATNTSVMVSIVEKDTNLPLYGKFVALYLKNSDMTDCEVGLTSAPESNDIHAHHIVGPVKSGQVKKFALLPFPNMTPFVYCLERSSNGAGYVWIDGLYVFRLLSPPTGIQ